MKPQLLVSALLAAIPLCRAGEPAPAPAMIAPAESEWEFLLALYSPMMGLDGTLGIAGISADVDVPFDEILDQLDGGFMAAFEARRNRWSVTGDFIWLKLSGSGNPTPDSYIGFKQEEILASVALGYELFGNDCTTLDLLGGVALTSLDVDLEAVDDRVPLRPPVILAGSGSETWIDPFVGLRLRHQLSDRWSIFATGLYGGFGGSSDEYWQVIGGVAFRMTEHSSLALGYRIISTDYQDGTFIYDIETSGPNLGLVFNF